MKSTVNNSRYAVVKTAAHGGGIFRLHRLLNEALKSARFYAEGDCCCGCCRVVPITIEAREEYVEYLGYSRDYAEDITLLEDLPSYEPDMYYGTICT